MNPREYENKISDKVEDIRELEVFVFIVDCNSHRVTIQCKEYDKSGAIEKFKLEYRNLYNRNWQVLKIDQFI